MSRLPTWRVRIKRIVEDWVDVEAVSALEAETEAYKIPGVVSVFGRSAIPGNQPIEGALPTGVHDE